MVVDEVENIVARRLPKGRRPDAEDGNEGGVAATRKEDLLTSVGTVPSGAVDVVRKQQKDGYAYFKP